MNVENLRKTVKSFPITEHYDVGETLTSLGIGEALVTVLSPEGVPTPLAATRLVPPDSSMDAVDEATRAELIAAGALGAKYGTPVDRESAHEIITAKLHGAAETAETGSVPPRPDVPAEAPAPAKSQAAAAKPKRQGAKPRKAAPKEKTLADEAKEAGIGLAKDLFTTADGRRTLRTVFGTLLGKK